MTDSDNSDPKKIKSVATDPDNNQLNDDLLINDLGGADRISNPDDDLMMDAQEAGAHEADVQEAGRAYEEEEPAAFDSHEGDLGDEALGEGDPEPELEDLSDVEAEIALLSVQEDHEEEGFEQENYGQEDYVQARQENFDHDHATDSDDAPDSDDTPDSNADDDSDGSTHIDAEAHLDDHDKPALAPETAIIASDAAMSEALPRRYSKWAMAAVAIMALLIGGASGGGFVQYGLPFLPDNLRPAAAKQADQSQRDLTRRLVALEDSLEKIGASDTGGTAAGQDFTESGLGDFESRLKALENAQADLNSDLASVLSTVDAAQSKDPVIIDEALVARLEALQKDGSAVLDLSEFQSRLDVFGAQLKARDTQNQDDLAAIEDVLASLLEQNANLKSEITQISQVQTTLQQSNAAQFNQASDNQASDNQASDDNAAGENNIIDDTDEAGANLLSGTSIAPKSGQESGQDNSLFDEIGYVEDLTPEEIASVEIADNIKFGFPKQILLNAVNAQYRRKPYFQRVLAKHIQIQDASNPEFLIEQISDSLSENNLEKALENFELLPSNLQSLARDWRNLIG